MPDFEILQKPNEVNNFLPKGNWVDAEKFNSKNRIVDESGNGITADYKGKKYRLIFKKERTFPTLERIGRVVLAILAVVFSLGIAIISKSIKKLFREKKTNIRFGILFTSLQKKPIAQNPNPTESPKNEETTSPNSQFKKKINKKKINKKKEYKISKQNLQEGVEISDEIISKIQECFEDIISRNNTQEIKHYNCNLNNIVFELTKYPEYIFKMKSCEKIFKGNAATQQRYRSMIEAKTICRIHNLGLLVIPNAKLFTVEINYEKYKVIAEKKLEIDPDESRQKEYFKKYAENLYETLRQFAIFTCKFGLSDVNSRNNNVLVNNPNENKEMSMTLFDSEERSGADFGLFGGNFADVTRPGLVGCCTNEKQIDIIKKVVEDHNKEVKEECRISTDNLQNAWEKRKKELEKTT